MNCIQQTVRSFRTAAHLKTNIRSTGSMFRLFDGEDHAKTYAKFRPTYTEEVHGLIREFCKDGGTGDAYALDVACGSGQSTIPLAAHYKQVLGVDISAAQISLAPKDLENTKFQVGNGEDLPFIKDGSVDLVTIAQGLHWLDRESFYKEVKRVLKPRGVLAAYGYGCCELDMPEANVHMKRFHTVTLNDWWEEERKLVDNLYKDIHLPFSETVRNHDYTIKRKLTLSEFVGYLSSFSAYRTLKKRNPESHLLEELANRLMVAYMQRNPWNTGESPVLGVMWPVFMLMSRKGES